MINNSSLQGKIIVITRASEKISESQKLFSSLGANILELPALIIGPPSSWGPLDQALIEINTFDWIIFSSSNGVISIEERLNLIGLSLSNKQNIPKIACVGKKTASTLINLNCKVDFIPPEYIADSLIDNFPCSVRDSKILIPRVETGGRPILRNSFLQLGANVVEIAAYESKCPKEIPPQTHCAFRDKLVDAITFTSSKTVQNTCKLLNENFDEELINKAKFAKLISIGPQTSLSCKKYFNRVDIEAKDHDLDGLVRACIKVFS